MCLICVEYQKGKMTFTEGFRALGEMAASLGEKHVAEVKKLLMDDLQHEYDALRQAVQSGGYGVETDEEDEEDYSRHIDDTATD